MNIEIEGREIRPAFSEETIKKRIKELGQEITNDYRGKDFVCVGILNGAYMFFAELVKSIDLVFAIDFISLSSYEGTKTTSTVTFHSDVKHSVEGKHVLLIEDVVDTGTTIYKSKIIDHFLNKGALSCKLCSFLSKPKKRIYPVKIDYLGYEAEPDFLVGFGFDWNQNYTNLQEIVYVKDTNTSIN